MKIVVLKGGTSTERDVSLVSGEAVGEALYENGHEVLELDTTLPIEQIRESLVPPVVTDDNEKLLKANLVKLLLTDEVQYSDIIFLALHGGEGENGTVQGLLEMTGLPYTGTGVRGSVLAMDKHVSKLIFVKNEIPTPEWFLMDSSVLPDELHEKILSTINYPVIIKPRDEGSTLGLSLVDNKEKLPEALRKIQRYSKEFIVEDYISGRELTVSILGNEPLPIVEIKPRHTLYDYECKYRKGMSQYITPAEIGKSLTEEIQELSLKAFKVLDCRDVARVDLRLSTDNKPFILEVNTIPGMTDTSLLPKAALAAGMGFAKLLETIIDYAVKRGR